VKEEKKEDHQRALLIDKVLYTTNRDLASAGDEIPSLIQSSALAFNSSFSLNGFERNFLFENRGDHFVDLGAVSGIDSDIDARSFGIGDTDRDGDLDLVVKNLQRRLLQYFVNEIDTDHRRVFFALRGTESNRDAIGARVEIHYGEGGFQMAEVRSASGFQAQSPNEVYFGLGEVDTIDRVEVFWPSGRRQTFRDVEAGHLWRIDETEGIADSKRLERRTAPGLRADSRAPVPKQTFFTKVREAPAFELETIHGKRVDSSKLFESPTIVSFIKTWLPTFEEHLDVLEKTRTRFPETEVVVFLVEPVDAPALARCRDREGLRFVRTAYTDYGPAYAQQTNMLFPSTFLVSGGEIVFDMIGNLDPSKTLEALQEKIR